MKAHVFLTLTRRGIVKMTKEKPTIGAGQRAVRLSIEVPDSAFDGPRTLDADLVIPAKALSYPTTDAPVTVEIWEP